MPVKQAQTAELVPSVSIDNLLAQRNAIVERLQKMLELLTEIEQLSESAFGSDDAAPRLECRRANASLDSYGIKHLIKRVDATAWQYLMHESGLRTFMDAEARTQWDKTLYEGKAEDIPDLTLETIWETFSNLNDQRGLMFERGVVKCFRQLSWDYKTNNPYLFGRRIILTNVLDIWNASANRRYSSGPSYTGCNRLDDLLRVMRILDGKPEQDHRQGAYSVLREHFSYDRHSSEPVELLELLTIKCFRNGNGHITFLRPDLVDKLNEIVKRHHPNALPAKR